MNTNKRSSAQRTAWVEVAGLKNALQNAKPKQAKKYYVGYREALSWVAENDDTGFLDDEDPGLFMSVTTCMIRDLYGKTDQQVINDLRKVLKDH